MVACLHSMLHVCFVARLSRIGINSNMEVLSRDSCLSSEGVVKILVLKDIRVAVLSQNLTIGVAPDTGVQQRQVGFRQPLSQTVLPIISRLLLITDGKPPQGFGTINLFIRLQGVKVFVS